MDKKNIAVTRNRLYVQVVVLKDVLESYPTATIENAIRQMEARIKEIDKYIEETQ